MIAAVLEARVRERVRGRRAPGRSFVRFGRSVLCPGVLVLTAALMLGAPPAGAATSLDPLCNQLSPLAVPCVALDKLAEGASAECRALGLPPADCALPLGHQVIADADAAYLRSWTHSAVAFQYQLGNSLPLLQAQWLGTHNSFNSPADGVTLSHEDSNQQLKLSEQLDIDMRALELDTHWLPALNKAGGHVVVCHGQPAASLNLGCTTEPPLTKVLPEIDSWLVGHPTQVIMLYLDDNFGPAAAYAETVSDLEAGLRRPDGSSMIYHPSAIGSRGCQELPLGVSRDQAHASGAQVIIVGDCESGWSSEVFGWDDHVESGSTPNYKPYPACDATYSRSVYDSEMVRYFEDSTLVTAVTGDLTETPAEYAAGLLSPAKVTSMTDCGVNLFGFDQILPDDGRLAASVWSWAPGEPVAADGSCAAQDADGRWRTQDCAATLPAACSTAGGGWTLSAATDFADAAAACSGAGGTFDLPRTGYQNSVLRTAAGSQAVWVDYKLSG
jgi:hypothetical protein